MKVTNWFQFELRLIPQEEFVHGTTVHGAAVHGTAVHGTTVHGTAVHGTAVHGTAVHSTTVHGTAVHGTAVHDAAAHGTADLRPKAEEVIGPRTEPAFVLLSGHIVKLTPKYLCRLLP